MTTKPKPLKYRIRKSDALAGSATLDPDDPRQIEGTAQEADPVAEVAEPEASEPPPTTGSADAEIEAIRREALTGRQLRMARRLSQKHGLTVSSDFDAVRQLRARGIDPFQRTSLLDLVDVRSRTSEADRRLPEPAPPAHLPGRPDHGLPQSAQVRQIRREIAQRRRRRLFFLFARLTMFVFLPTFLAGYYFYAVATPMYATKSEFLIQQANTPGQTSLGGLFSGTSFATSQDSISVQSYLQSRDAMLRLDADMGFKAHFQQPHIDALQRLDADATNEDAFSLFRDRVIIGYDPSEGLVKMEVVAADAATSAAFSAALISYAEEQVDNLTQRLRADQMKGAEASFAEAETKMVAAQDKVLDLQVRLGVLDPASESAAIFGQVSQFEGQLQQKNLELQQLLSNPAPSEARVNGVRADIARIEGVVAELRAQLTAETGGDSSLASVSAQLRMAETDLQTRTLMMQQALQQLETARIEANRQVRYLSVGVSPVAPDEPTYPKAFTNTLLAGLIFLGIYLLISLTVSILREQVSG